MRRGYFVEGLGGAQFALPGAVERLRAERERAGRTGVHVLAATTTRPIPTARICLAAPRRQRRRALRARAGRRVVLVDGEPVLYLERGRPRPSSRCPASTTTRTGVHWRCAGPGDVHAREPRAAIERIDGEPAAESPRAPAFARAGFVPGYRGLTYRPPRAEFARA